MGGSLELMKITGYTDENFQTAFPGSPYTVMINPDAIKWQRGNDYNDQQAQDTASPSQKYKSTPSDKLSFDIVIDCTGIVDSTRTEMVTEIDALKKIVFTYNGTIHRPNFVKVQWGEHLIFNGVLTSFDISYTLFKPDGSALRAKISLAFSKYVSAQTLEQQKANESPDVTHLVTVEDCMALPQLCRKVLGKDSYYVQVARFNRLDKFRDMKRIRKLVFPPIIQSS